MMIINIIHTTLLFSWRGRSHQTLLDYYLVSQGVEGWSLSRIKIPRGGSVIEATRGGVGLDNDVSTMIRASFGIFSKGQFLALNLSTHHHTLDMTSSKHDNFTRHSINSGGTNTLTVALPSSSLLRGSD